MPHGTAISCLTSQRWRLASDHPDPEPLFRSLHRLQQDILAFNRMFGASWPDRVHAALAPSWSAYAEAAAAELRVLAAALPSGYSPQNSSARRTAHNSGKAFWARGSRLCTGPKPLLERVLSNWLSSGPVEPYSHHERHTSDGSVILPNFKDKTECVRSSESLPARLLCNQYNRNATANQQYGFGPRSEVT